MAIIFIKSLERKEQKGLHTATCLKSPFCSLIITYMIIIANFINCIIKYAKTGNILCVPMRGCHNCPYERYLHRHGSYSRNLITFNGCFRVSIQRYKCPSCGKTFSLRPFFILPYFQYSFFVIFSILLQSFVFKLSYSKILLNFLCTKHLSLISISHISFYTKRFKLCFPQTKLFLLSSGLFAQDTNDNTYEFSTSVISIMSYINQGNNFILKYHLSLHKHFMQKT